MIISPVSRILLFLPYSTSWVQCDIYESSKWHDHLFFKEELDSSLEFVALSIERDLRATFSFFFILVDFFCTIEHQGIYYAKEFAKVSARTLAFIFDSFDGILHVSQSLQADRWIPVRKNVILFDSLKVAQTVLDDTGQVLLGIALLTYSEDQIESIFLVAFIEHLTNELTD